MTRQVGARWPGGLSLLALASAFGCEAQVSNEYTGEPLLSLQGHVLVSEAQAGTNLVPYLAFSEGDTTVLVKGNVTGEFPAKFRFDVTQPPPPGTFLEVNEGGVVGRAASGWLVVAPPDHPERLPSWLDREHLDSQCADDFSECTDVVRQCDPATHRCRERTYHCIKRPCDLVGHTADAALDYSTSTTESFLHCVGQSCDLIESECDAAGSCATNAYVCDYGRYGSPGGFSEGSMATCTLLSESGDPALTSFNDLNTVAIGYLVTFLSDNAPDSAYGPLEQGYNLLQLPDAGAGDWVELKLCAITTKAKAVARYNQEHGTSYSGLAYEEEFAHLESAAEEECGFSPVRVIPEPLAEALTIELGNAHPEKF